MIKVFTHKNYIGSQTNEPLFPLLDDFVHQSNSKLSKLYVFVDDIQDCDIIILPIYIDYLLQNKKKSVVDLYYKFSSQYSKPLWVFSSGDLGLTIKKPNVFVFRLADFESKRRFNSIIMPPFIEDPIEKFYESKACFLKKTSKPKIGYVGQANNSFYNDLSTILIFLKYNLDIFTGKICSDYYKLYFFSKVRYKCLKKIESLNSISTNFIYRKKYRAGVKTELQRKTTTTEFYENIKNTHYTFCIRGGGNFSIRLYETLAMGRIPILINTDCSLPFQSNINWEKHCLIIEKSNFNNLEHELLKFHNKYDEKEFIDLQESNRMFWKNYFTRAGYFSKIHDLYCNGKL